MILSPPAFLVLAPLALGLPLLLLRRLPFVTGLLGPAGALWLVSRLATWATASADLPAWRVLGRPLTLSADVITALQLVYSLMALLFLLTLIWPQGTPFVPVAFLIVSPLTAGLMVQPFTFGLLALVAAACLGAVLVQSNRAGSAQGALRYVTLTALTIPLFLGAGWIFESGTSTFYLAGGRLILAGTLILLAGFPFHIWVPILWREAPPLVVAFLLGPAGLLVLLFCVRLLAAAADFLAPTEVALWLRGSGIATLLLAGMLATQAPNLERLLGYAVLADIGFLLVGLAQHLADPALGLGLLLGRSLSLTAAGLGLSSLRRQGVAGPPLDGTGAAWTRPVGVLLFTFGFLGLLGLPLTPGFTSHWTILQESAAVGAWLPPTLLLGIALALIGLIRSGRPFLQPVDTASSWRRDWRQWLLGGMLVGGIGLSLVPASWLSYADRIASGIQAIGIGG